MDRDKLKIHFILDNDCFVNVYYDSYYWQTIAGLGVWFGPHNIYNASAPAEMPTNFIDVKIQAAAFASQQAAKAGLSRINMHTDSLFLVKCFLNNWIDKWKKADWKRNNGVPVKNKEHLENLSDTLGKFEAVKWVFTQVRLGAKGILEAEMLAREGALKCDPYFRSKKKDNKSHKNGMNTQDNEDNKTGEVPPLQNELGVNIDESDTRKETKRKLWDSGDMKNAIDAVNRGHMNIYRASEVFNVPKTTLARRHLKNVHSSEAVQGNRSKSKEPKEELVELEDEYLTKAVTSIHKNVMSIERAMGSNHFSSQYRFRYLEGINNRVRKLLLSRNMTIQEIIDYETVAIERAILKERDFIVDEEGFVHVYVSGTGTRLAVWFNDNHKYNIAEPWFCKGHWKPMATVGSIHAATRAVRLARSMGLTKLDVHTKNVFLIRIFLNGWIGKWKQQNWMKSCGTPVKWKPFIEQLGYAVGKMLCVKWSYERPKKDGHSGFTLGMKKADFIVQE